MLMSSASFGFNHHESDVQTVYIQDTYLDLGSHLNIPVQEQASELDSYYDMPKLMWGIQTKDYG